MKIHCYKGYINRNYEGHTKSVKMMSVFAEKNIFLSVAQDCVKIWKLPELDSTSPEPEARTPSPSQRQLDFTHMFPDKKTVESRISWYTLDSHKEPIVWACFSSAGNKIATCSTIENKVEVWGFDTKEKFLLTWVKAAATSCIFSYDDKHLIIGCASSYIIIFNIQQKVYLNLLVDSYPILSLFTLPGTETIEKFGVLTKATLGVWEIKNTAVHSNEKTKHHHNLRRTGENESFVCCTAALDGSVVAVAKSSGRIDLCDLNDGQRLGEINDSSSNIKYLAVKECKEPLLLGSYSETLKLWTLGAALTGKQAIMKPNFAITWTDNNKPILVAPTSQNYCIKRVPEDTEPDHLMVETDSVTDLCAISKCGRYVVASTKSNQVFIHRDGTSTNMIQILNTNKEAIRQLKMEVLQGHILVAVGCNQSVIVWMEKETAENGSTTVNITLKLDRVEDYFILSREELVVISSSGSVKKWCLNTSKPVQTLCEARLDVKVCHTELSEKNLVVLTSQTFKKLSSGNEVFKWFLHSYNLDAVSETNSFELESKPTCCSFSDDGRRLAIGFQNGTVQVYNCDGWIIARHLESVRTEIVSVCMSIEGLVCAATETRVILHTVTGGQGQAKLSVKHLVMSPDNRTIITVDIHGHLHFINELNPGQASFALRQPKVKSKRHSLSLP